MFKTYNAIRINKEIDNINYFIQKIERQNKSNNTVIKKNKLCYIGIPELGDR